MPFRQAWSRQELLAAGLLYCEIPFGRFHQHNPEIIQAAEAMGRTPSALAMKLCNLEKARVGSSFVAFGVPSSTTSANLDRFAEIALPRILRTQVGEQRRGKWGWTTNLMEHGTQILGLSRIM